MNTKNLYPVIIILALVGFFVGCSEMDDLHEPYIKDGEQIYIGKAISPQYFPGKNRIKFSWTINADPKITKAIISWRDTEDRTVEFPVSAGSGIVEKTIEDIPEGGYNFDIYMGGDNGERSVKVQLTGVVYGDRYQSSISNPLTKAVYYNLNKNPTNSLDLEWLGVADQTVVIDVKYTNTTGSEVTVRQARGLTSLGKPAPFAERTILSQYAAASDIWYRSGFVPSTAAIDTFFTEYSQVSSVRINRMIRPGLYRIVAKHSGKALRVRDNSANGNAQIEQNTYSDLNPSFKWTLKYNLDGYAVFTNRNSILDIAVSAAATTDGANVTQIAQLIPTQTTCNCHDEWTITPIDANNNLFRIINRNSNKVIEIQSGALTDGASAQQRTFSATATHQRFEFIPVQ